MEFTITHVPTIWYYMYLHQVGWLVAPWFALLLCWSIFSACDTVCAKLEIANIEGWPVLNWLVHVSRSSCKGTFGLLHFMGSTQWFLLF